MEDHVRKVCRSISFHGPGGAAARVSPRLDAPPSGKIAERHRIAIVYDPIIGCSLPPGLIFWIAGTASAHLITCGGRSIPSPVRRPHDNRHRVVAQPNLDIGDLKPSASKRTFEPWARLRSYVLFIRMFAGGRNAQERATGQLAQLSNVPHDFVVVGNCVFILRRPMSRARIDRGLKVLSRVPYGPEWSGGGAFLRTAPILAVDQLKVQAIK